MNERIAIGWDRLLPVWARVDGNGDFQKSVLPPLLQSGLTIYDLGGGSRPMISQQVKTEKNLTVVGMDIDARELAAAPPGVYDRTIVADLTTFEGAGEADLVICQATLEHVRSTELAIRGISSALKPGGRAAIFVPCRNALFARLNLALPQQFKKRLLGAMNPSKATGHDGFPAFYDHCTPRRLSAFLDAHGMEVERVQPYWRSSYFFSFLPAYLAWRLWTFVSRGWFGNEACETFALVARKR